MRKDFIDIILSIRLFVRVVFKNLGQMVSATLRGGKKVFYRIAGSKVNVKSK